jgi:thioredoxin 2
MTSTATESAASPPRLDDRGVITRCPACGTANRLPYDKIGRQGRCQRCQTELPFPAEPIDAESETAFNALIARSALPVIVDFWAAWCGPCKMMAPEFRRVAADGAGRWLAIKADTDALQGSAARHGIQALPTVVLFHGGREVARESGARPAAALRSFIERNL